MDRVSSVQTHLEVPYPASNCTVEAAGLEGIQSWGLPIEWPAIIVESFQRVNIDNSNFAGAPRDTEAILDWSLGQTFPPTSGPRLQLQCLQLLAGAGGGSIATRTRQQCSCQSFRVSSVEGYSLSFAVVLTGQLPLSAQGR